MTETARVPFVGAFESTYLPAHDTDILETSGHVDVWREDLELLRAHGVTRLRYPIRWHRVEASPMRFDWRETDAVLGWMRSEGFEPIVDLVHHTSYPGWLTGSFADERFPAAFLRYCEAFARRYPWVPAYTLFNEPFATLFLSGHEAVWPPYRHGTEGFVELLRNVIPALARASRLMRELLPGARHYWTDSCEGHSGRDAAGAEHAATCDDRRFFALDAFLGRGHDRDRPFVAEVVAAGGADLLEIEPGHVDVLGLDYYAQHEWSYGEAITAVDGAGRHPHGPGHPRGIALAGHTPSSTPRGLARLALEYAEHTRLPLMLGETNLMGAPFDRATWLKYTLAECEATVRAGVPLDGYCWFGFLDSLDWGSLLARCDRSIDPVGVIWLDEDLGRNASTMSRAYASAARGAPSSELPAYRLDAASAAWIAGFLPFMEGYDWQDPPAEEVHAYARGRLTAGQRRIRASQ